MKKALVITLVSVVAVVLILFSVVNFYGNKYDKDSKIFAEKVIPLIIDGWSVQMLMDNSCKNFNKTLDEKKIIETMNNFKKQFGSYQKIVSVTGEAILRPNIFSNEGIFVIAKYMIKTEFSKAKPEIALKLMRENGEWKIFDIAVSPQ